MDMADLCFQDHRDYAGIYERGPDHCMERVYLQLCLRVPAAVHRNSDLELDHAVAAALVGDPLFHHLAGHQQYHRDHIHGLVHVGRDQRHIPALPRPGREESRSE